MKLLLLLVTLVCTKACPPWTVYNSSSDQCQCGDDLGGVVYCNRETLKVSVLYCYCMTHNRQTNETLVGKCLANCVHRIAACMSNTDITTNDSRLLDNELCKELNRTGQLCGDCIEGYGPPVYSYSLKCVKCKESNFRYNLFKYIVLAFLPLTVFYLVVIIFKISVTTGSMVAYVLICQMFTSPAVMRFLFIPSKLPNLKLKYLIAFYSLWNLDICRSLYKPFCIHPEMSTLQILALDYVVGIYPLVLILLTYIAVTLHDRYPLIVKIWKPAYKCFICIRREWNIRGSLVQAFATFLLLSYVKILNVSFDLLTPVFLHTVEGKQLKQAYLYYAGDIPYFGREHLLYGILAVAMITLFNILPVILLLIYPCPCIHKIMNKYKLHSHALHTFMDTFQGCYRHQTRDCRYFSALYLILRILQLSTFAIIRSPVFISIIAMYLIILTASLLIIRPYKKELHNKIEGSFFTLFASICLLAFIDESTKVYQHTIIRPLSIVLLIFPILYGTLMLIRKVLPKKFTNIKCCFSFYISRNQNTANIIESLHYQFEYEDEYTPLK